MVNTPRRVASPGTPGYNHESKTFHQLEAERRAHEVTTLHVNMPQLRETGAQPTASQITEPVDPSRGASSVQQPMSSAQQPLPIQQSSHYHSVT